MSLAKERYSHRGQNKNGDNTGPADPLGRSHHNLLRRAKIPSCRTSICPPKDSASLMEMNGPGDLPALIGLQADAQHAPILPGIEDLRAVAFGPVKGIAGWHGNKQLIGIPAHDPARAGQPAALPRAIDEADAPACNMAVRCPNLRVSLTFPDAQNPAV